MQQQRRRLGYDRSEDHGPIRPAHCLRLPGALHRMADAYVCDLSGLSAEDASQTFGMGTANDWILTVFAYIDPGPAGSRVDYFIHDTKYLHTCINRIPDTAHSVSGTGIKSLCDV